MVVLILFHNSFSIFKLRIGFQIKKYSFWRSYRRIRKLAAYIEIRIYDVCFCIKYRKQDSIFYYYLLLDDF